MSIRGGLGARGGLRAGYLRQTGSYPDADDDIVEGPQGSRGATAKSEHASTCGQFIYCGGLICKRRWIAGVSRVAWLSKTWCEPGFIGATALATSGSGGSLGGGGSRCVRLRALGRSIKCLAVYRRARFFRASACSF